MDSGDNAPSLLRTPPDPKRRTPPYSPLRGLTFSSNTFSRHDRVSKLPLFIWLNEKVRQTGAVLNGILQGTPLTPLHDAPESIAPTVQNLVPLGTVDFVELNLPFGTFLSIFAV